MKFNLTSIISASVLAAATIAAPAFAGDAAAAAAKQVLPLKDGSTLYVFANGKMAKESKYGQAIYLKSGDVLETVDGKKITPVGNEVAVLSGLLSNGHRNR